MAHKVAVKVKAPFKLKPGKKFNPEKLTRTLVKHSEHRVQVLTKESSALKLAKQGVDYESIGEKLGVSTKEAYELVKAGVERWTTDMKMDASLVRELELRRLDAILAILWPDIEGRQTFLKTTDGLVIVDDNGRPKVEFLPPDLDAIRIALQIMERRAKYLGLDAANKMKVDQTITIREYVGVSPEDL